MAYDLSLSGKLIFRFFYLICCKCWKFFLGLASWIFELSMLYFSYRFKNVYLGLMPKRSWMAGGGLRWGDREFVFMLLFPDLLPTESALRTELLSLQLLV